MRFFKMLVLLVLVCVPIVPVQAQGGAGSELAVGDYVVFAPIPDEDAIRNVAGPEAPDVLDFLWEARGNLAWIVDGPRYDTGSLRFWLVESSGTPGISEGGSCWVPEMVNRIPLMWRIDSYGPQFQTTIRLLPTPPLINAQHQLSVGVGGGGFTPNLVSVAEQAVVYGDGFETGDTVQVRIIQPDGVVFLEEARVVTSEWGELVVKWTPLPQHPLGLWTVEMTGPDGVTQTSHLGVIPSTGPNVNTVCQDEEFTLVLDGFDPGTNVNVRLMQLDREDDGLEPGYRGETVYAWPVTVDDQGQLLATFSMEPEWDQYVVVELGHMLVGDTNMDEMPFVSCAPDASVFDTGRVVVNTSYQDVAHSTPFVYEFWAGPDAAYGLLFELHPDTPGTVHLELMAFGGELLATSKTGVIEGWTPDEWDWYTVLAFVDGDAARGKLVIVSAE